MDTITKPRRGRARKVIPNAGDVKQSAIDTANGNGNGQDSAARTEPQAKSDGQGEGCSWLELVDKVKSHDGLISMAWHPSGETESISTNASDVRVLVGDAAYQLSTGEIISL